MKLLGVSACSMLALSSFMYVCAQYVCPVFFDTGNEIVCITKNNRMTSHYEKLYSKDKQNGCKTKSYLPFVHPWNMRFRNVDCRFEDLRYGLRGQKVSFIKLFWMGKENPNTIFRSEELNFMCGLKSLILTGANIGTIKSNAFFCLKNMSYLDLSYNRIQTLPEKNFEETESLSTLSLSSNLIDVLPPDVFKNARNLTALNLSSNLIKILPADVFSDLSNLKDLKLDNNSLETVDVLLFNLIRLVSLHLNHNKLKSINNDTFSQNALLEILDISHNDISFLSKNAFVANSNLRKLYINHNRLKEIALETFQPTRGLEYLDLSWNEIAELKSGTFLNSDKLRALLLSKNRLSRIRDGDFSGLVSIELLDIDSNSIEFVDSGSFKRIQDISTLHFRLLLSNNKLRNLSNVFSNIGIRQLDISKNLGFMLNNEMFAGSAEELTLNTCNITFLPEGAFRNYVHLHYLDLSNNAIREINSMTFFRLYSLDLSYNKIEKFDASSIMGLAFLDISHNNLFKLECNDPLHSLTNLNVSSNSLTEYTCTAPMLQIANFSHNQISSLKNLLSSNYILHSLDISYNKLSHITSDEWKNIIRISDFNAANNVIKEIIIPEPSDYNLSAYAFREIHLQYQYNKLETIKLPKSLKREISSATIKVTINIYLSHNPLVCQCSAYKIHTYLKEFDASKHYMNIADDDELLCYLPTKLEPKVLRDLEPTEFWCDYDKECFDRSLCPPVPDCNNRCSCYYRPYDDVRIVDCSNRNYSTLPQNVPHNIEFLYMDWNSLTSLAELNQPQWQHLKEIHFEYNEIDSEDIPIPKDVTFLGLRGNKLKTFPASIKTHSENNNNFKVTLSGNLWPCECSILTLKAFLRNYPHQVIDIDNVTCSFPIGSTLPLNKASDFDLCPPSDDKTMVYVTIAIAGTFMTLVVVCSVLYLKYKLYILATNFDSGCPSCNGRGRHQTRNSSDAHCVPCLPSSWRRHQTRNSSDAHCVPCLPSSWRNDEQEAIEL